MINQWVMLARLAVACVLGGAIGMQREGANRPAGFRTHVLVALGSALIMLISIYGFEGVGSFHDPARIAAQVVSGIGFLGAGTIMKEGFSIRGLTTAASLWVVAAIGLACGSGFYIGAVACTVLVYVVLTTFSYIEKRLFHPSHYLSLGLLIRDQPGQLGRIGVILGALDVSIRNISLSRVIGDEGFVHVHLELKLPCNIAPTEVIGELAELPGVSKVDGA